MGIGKDKGTSTCTSRRYRSPTAWQAYLSFTTCL